MKTSDIYIVTEYTEENLKNVISFGLFNSKEIKSYMYMILCGLYSLHHSNIVFKELCPSNILIDNKSSLKLINFGIFSIIDPNLYTNNNVSFNESKNYKSPEFIMEYDKVGKPMDIWALGCIFGELLQDTERKPLFEGLL